MEMYREKIDNDFFNISIDGLDLIAEDIIVNESFNRRETIRKNIIGGTQHVIRGGYLPRDFTIHTHVLVDPLFPDVYDSTFQEWHSKPVEVISRELGGKFDAEVIVKRTHDAPNYLKLDIHIVEIPSSTSNIPNDSMKVKSDELKETTTTTNGDGTVETVEKGGNITNTVNNEDTGENSVVASSSEDE